MSSHTTLGDRTARTAPRLPFDIIDIDHIRFQVGNAKQAAHFYARTFGMTPVAYREPAAGTRDGNVEYLLRSGSVRFLLTGGVSPRSAPAAWAAAHGDGVSDIALTVSDVDEAHRHAVGQGATSLAEPRDIADERGVVRHAAIAVYGDLRHTLLDRSRFTGSSLPGFTEYPAPAEPHAWYRRIDHVVGCVEVGGMDQWVDFYRRVLGFTTMAEFIGDDIATEYSALMSRVAADPARRIKLPMNEPAAGKRRSQIDEYLEYHAGPGVQHIALETDDILGCTDFLRSGGIEFLPTPDSYYEDPELRARIGTVRVPIEELRRRGILVDRDEDGYLLQIFTRPLLDRPTFFLEIIERNGSAGFGKGNFKALFEAVEREQGKRGNL
ncbi:4-hydroxyphenylpyruvate dioxygenase [Nocardia sp. BMG51109]|uniref:4-hydroxyphenylpyruvate dioxygenase n=1 Tax=Nocardia sp. BMG51109 TaxID=1056816 RepID=UPI00046577F3|nr:4-hydroxyphenylpyruvate dioxygenase [Nocardia sp. BMG51109]